MGLDGDFEKYVVVDDLKSLSTPGVDRRNEYLLCHIYQYLK